MDEGVAGVQELQNKEKSSFRRKMHKRLARLAREIGFRASLLQLLQLLNSFFLARFNEFHRSFELWRFIIVYPEVCRVQCGDLLHLIVT